MSRLEHGVGVQVWSWHRPVRSLARPLWNFGLLVRGKLTTTLDDQPAAQSHTNDRFPSNTQPHIMDTAAKTPVKLVKVTRVLGRTGTHNPTRGESEGGAYGGLDNERARNAG